MTTATMTIGTRTMEPTPRPRRSLEELVDRLMDSLTFVEAPSPVQVAPADTTADASPAKPRRSLEELVDNLMATLTFREGPATAAAQPAPGAVMTEEPTPHSVTRSIHEARRLRQSGDLDGALETLAAGPGHGGAAPGPVGLHRVEAAGEASVWHRQRPGLQPGHWPRRGPCSQGQRPP